MQIKYHKNFTKSFKKLTPLLKDKTKKVIIKFTKNPRDKTLKNHKLTGKLNNKRAISVTGDIRIIFEQHNNYILVIFLDIGSHNQVYK